MNFRVFFVPLIHYWKNVTRKSLIDYQQGQARVEREQHSSSSGNFCLCSKIKWMWTLWSRNNRMNRESGGSIRKKFNLSSNSLSAPANVKMNWFSTNEQQRKNWQKHRLLFSPSNVVVVGFSIVECQKSALAIEKNTQIEVQNAWARLSPTIFTIFLHRIGNKSPGLAKKIKNFFYGFSEWIY